MICNSNLNDYEKICSSCIVYIILFVIFFIINISIRSVFYLFSLVLKKKICWNNDLLNAILFNIKIKHIKKINIKNRIYYFFNDMISIKDFDSSLTKTDSNSHKNIEVYNIGYIPMKKMMIMKVLMV